MCFVSYLLVTNVGNFLQDGIEFSQSDLFQLFHHQANKDLLLIMVLQERLVSQEEVLVTQSNHFTAGCDESICNLALEKGSLLNLQPVDLINVFS